MTAMHLKESEAEFNDFVIKQMPWDHFCLIHFVETDV